jgi:hypothetical protein
LADDAGAADAIAVRELTCPDDDEVPSYGSGR